MNFRIIMKSNEADSEIGFLTKSISKPYGRATAMPPAWELNKRYNNNLSFLKQVWALKFSDWTVSYQNKFIVH